MKLVLKSTIVLMLVVFSRISEATTYYSSPTGKSSNLGNSANSPLDLLSGINKLSAGDVLQLAGGKYTIPFVKDKKNTIFFTKSGTAQKPITIQTANGEKATLDFSFPLQEWVQDGFGFDITGDYWIFKNINITRAGYHGVYVKGNYNTFDNCAFYENRNTGLEINKGGSYTTVINCDAYRNYDPKKKGSMADGFAPKQKMGPGNKFIGCRSWENSDDGYDCFDSPELVTFENCWAFRNGIDVWNYGGFTGNGNGFKLGGNYAAAKNKVSHCVSFGHPQKGFDQNHNTAALTILNCTSYSNGNNYGINEATTSGEKHYFRNNISIGQTPSTANVNSAYNSWDSGFSVSNSDFISLVTSLATVARNADGNIPYTDLFRLKTTSKLVNAGTDVGLAYEGSAPDLGAFEVVENSNKDCNGDVNGKAYLDNCGVCVGGKSVNKTCVGSLEAETACSVDGVLSESLNAGFSGEGYVNTDNLLATTVSWVVNSTTNQQATLSFRYANGGTTSRDGSITINETSAGKLALPFTGAWSTWKVVSVNVTLQEGANQLVLTATTADGLANLDVIHFSAGVSAGNCTITGVNTLQKKTLTVYPNPTKNSVYWNLEMDYSLINSTGNVVTKGRGMELDLSTYPRGVYFLRSDEGVVPLMRE